MRRFLNPSMSVSECQSNGHTLSVGQEAVYMPTGAAGIIVSISKEILTGGGVSYAVVLEFGRNTHWAYKGEVDSSNVRPMYIH